MKVIKNTIVYTVVAFLQKSVNFFLLPVYTLYLSAADYGIVNVVNSIVGFLSILFMLALHGAASRFHFQCQNDEEVRELWGTILSLVVINSVCWGIVFILFQDYLLAPFARNIAFFPYLLCGIVTVMLSPFYVIYQSYLQARQEGVRYGVNNIAYFFLNLTLTLVFVVVFDLKALGVLLSLAVTNLVFAVYSMSVFVPQIKLRIAERVMGKSLKYALPLLPHTVSGWITEMIDRIILNNMTSTARVGVYGIGYQVGMLQNTVTSSVHQAYVPWFFEKSNEGEPGKAKIAQFSEVLIVAYAFVALVISLFSPEIFRLMVTSSFVDGWKVVPFIAFSYSFNGLYYIFASTLLIRKTTLLPLITVLTAIISVGLNWFLIKRYDMIGAAIASFLSLLVSSVIALVVASRAENYRFSWIKMYGVTFAFFLFSLVIYLDSFLNNLQLFLFKMSLVVFLCSVSLFAYRKEVAKFKNEFLVIFNKGISTK